jgi:hypothetical protein
VRGEEIGYKQGARVGRRKVSTHRRFAVQGVPELLCDAASHGDEGRLKQLIAAKADLHAQSVSYRSCTRVSLPQ